MKHGRLFIILFALALAQTSIGSVAPEADWPQWHGPDRTGLSKETGLLKAWPATGPSTVWTISNLGEGFGSVAIKADRIFVQGARSGDSVIFGLNRADGKVVWTQALGPKGNDSRGNGPRATPTVDGDRVYGLSENGDLACLKTGDGAVVWRRNILKDFGGSNPGWLISESPLVDGNNLIVTPGGEGASLVALDKMTGKTVWTSKELSDPAGYSSCLAADIQGVRAIVGFTARAAVGVRATDGKLMWRYEPVANRTANITTPVIYDNKVFYTSAYGTGCALLGLKAQGGEVKAEEIYFNREMQNHHGGVVLVNGYVYGFSNNILTCMEFATGKTLWKDRSVGKGSLTYADGNLYLLSENNVVGLAEASPEGYKEKGRFQIPDQGWPSWAHPVVCGGRLYIRNQGTLACYEIKAKG
ncbi:MAG TPA: PQQ-binding-like beta-propeller repeat protein [Blastocatellia bacterium]|jgi:outer membrane protein assembly factor BamB|nr:PQQ-binding-like beta-propeller repeat protein [Blastocatellia bacterium]